MPGVFTPYTTGVPMFGGKPSWIQDELDQQRIQSYQLYEQIYWNVPETFKVSLRGSNEKPIYVPTGRTIIDTTNRYTAPGITFSISNRTPSATPSADVQAARLAWDDLMTRERFRSKYNGGKRYNLIRGDWIWYITADPTKPVGSRISLNTLDPAMYFPITDEEDVDKIVGVHLVEQITTDDGPRIRRVTYRKIPRADGTNQITVEEGIFEVDKWGGPGFSPAKVVRPPTPLPDEITALPVYHIKNFDEPGNPFGSSELRGLETLMTAVNQVMSDEDLALALDGIGVYATDAPEPVDSRTGQPVPWRLGPGRVAHHPPDTNFNRITGVGSVTPYGDHYDRLMTALKQASATPDVAIGSVDVQVAQSGIALALQLGPMLAKTEEKTGLILDGHDQMAYDLINGWFPAFEETSFQDVAIKAIAGTAVPVDREKRFAELHTMYEDKVIDAEYYRAEARKLGYDIPEDMGSRVQAEQDAFAARMTGELDGSTEQ